MIAPAGVASPGGFGELPRPKSAGTRPLPPRLVTTTDPDSSSVQADTLKAGIARDSGEADSLRDVDGATAADSLSPHPPRRTWSWSTARLPWPDPVGAFTTLGPPEVVDRAVDYPMRDAVAVAAGLQRVPSPAHHLPDPVDPGDLPGRETPAVLLEGMPLPAPGDPGLAPDAVGPLWLGRVMLHDADPIRLPSNPSGGQILELELLGPDSTRAASAARATRGTGGVFTEEFFLARPSGSGLWRFGYQDTKSEGRFETGYLAQFAENLLLRFDRGTSWGGWRLGWHRQIARVRPFWFERYAFHRSSTEAGLLVRHAGWRGDLSLAVTWNRQLWDGSPAALRKDAFGRGLLRVEGPGDRVRPRVTFQLDRNHLRFRRDEPGGTWRDKTSFGPGIAAGIEGVSGTWRYQGSGGLSSPIAGKSDWTAAFDASRRLPHGWRLAAHLDRMPRAPLVPRLAGDLASIVGQGVWLASTADSASAALIDPGRPLEVISRFGLELRRTKVVDREPATASGFFTAGLARKPPDEALLRVRGVSIAHAVAPTGEEFALFVPESWGLLSAAARDATIRVVSARLHARQGLAGGFGFFGSVTGRLSDPGWRDQLWMTPVEGSFRLSWGARFFEGDLEVEGFLRGEVAGRRGTPYGELPWSDRYDAGALARVESLTFSFLLINLESDETAAADFDETAGWVTLPLRTYRMGLTWRFTD